MEMHSKKTASADMISSPAAGIRGRSAGLAGALLLALLLVSPGSRAQQIPLYGSYLVNPFSLNPAEAGRGERVNLFGMVRNQYAGFEGSPTTQMLTVDGGLNERVGLGLKLVNEQTDILRNTRASLAYSYGFSLSEKAGIRLGVAVTGGQRSLDFDRVFVEDRNEQVVFDDRISQVHIEGEAGMTFSYQKLRIGLAVPQLLGDRWEYEDDGLNQQVRFQNQRHFMATAQYPFEIVDGRYTLEPMVLTRMASGAPFQFDGNLTLRNPDLWYATAGYRNGYSVTAGGGVILSQQFMLGYSYDYPTGDIAAFTGGSHEVVLGFSFGGAAADEKQLPREEVEMMLQEQAEREAQKRQALENKMDSLGALNAKQREDLDYFREKMNDQDAELRALKEKYRPEPGGAGTGSGRSEDAGDPGAVPSGERPEEAEELEQGQFLVVVASFRKFEDAVNYQQFLARARDGRSGTRITRSASGNWYFLYRETYDNARQAQQRLNELPRNELIPRMRPWIYRVGD